MPSSLGILARYSYICLGWIGLARMPAVLGATAIQHTDEKESAVTP